MNLRQAEISELLNSELEVNVQDLAERFGVSQMTIRRDLTLLEDKNLAIRTHGGAMLAGKLRFLRRDFPDQGESSENNSISKLAVSLIHDGDTVMVDSCDIAFEVAIHFRDNPNITIATTSLRVAQALYGSELNVLVLGGFLRDDNPCLYGPLTEQTLLGFNVDTLFISCDGADSIGGFYSSDLNVASLAQSMINAAHQVVVVADSPKFNRRSFAHFALPEQIEYLITDSDLSERDRSNLEERGVKVLMTGMN